MLTSAAEFCVTAKSVTFTITANVTGNPTSTLTNTASDTDAIKKMRKTRWREVYQ